ncbi:MAG: hemolysin family protein [bacterium]|jgi:gliding motility-associated protein GldE|nr:hemolysin family protein [bacterium]
MLAELVLFALLLVLSGFFSGSETAFFSLGKLQIKQQREDGGAPGRRVAHLLGKPQRLLVTILVGNTVANTAAATLATLMAHHWAVSVGLSLELVIPVTIIFVTLSLLIVSEVTPKALAFRHNVELARAAALPLQLSQVLLWPLVKPILAITNVVRRRFKDEDGVPFTPGELKTLLEVGAEEGSLEEDEKELIHSIFEFGETTVREVMVPRIDMICLAHDTGLEEAVDLIRREGHSRIPMYRERVDNVIGVLYAKDLIPFLHQREALPALDQLARLPYFVPEGKKIDELLREFQANRIHMAIVVDEYGGTAGLVTLEDILEEIVGEIQDEFDAEAPPWRRTADEGWVIDSGMLLEDVNALLEEEILPTAEEYETLGGFIYELAGEVPKAGDTYEHLGWRFTVMTMKRHRIGLVKTKRVEPVARNERDGN